MVNVISKETQLQRNLELNRGTTKVVEYTVDGEIHTIDIPRRPSGELMSLELNAPIGEFLGSSDMIPELAEKVTVDVELGREEVPLLYQSLYQTFVNANFPRLLDANQIMYANVVFLQHLEGAEVRFGSIASETGVTVPLLTYTAGFEWNQDVEVYDEGWRVAMANTALGRSYNALLNHLHLSPIVTYNYAGMTEPNTTAALTPSGNQVEDTRATLRQALQDAATNLDLNGIVKPIRPTTIVCGTGDSLVIQDALSLADRPSLGTVADGGPIDVLLGRVGDTNRASVNNLTSIIVYDGQDIDMGDLTFNYAGPSAGKAWLVQPKRNLFEFVKHDMQVQSQRPADLSRLVAEQMVAVTRRGLLMSPELSVWEVTLP